MFAFIPFLRLFSVSIIAQALTAGGYAHTGAENYTSTPLHGQGTQRRTWGEIRRTLATAWIRIRTKYSLFYRALLIL